MLTYIHTYQPDDKNVQINMPFFERGYNDVLILRRVIEFIAEIIGTLDFVRYAQVSVQFIQLSCS